MVKDARFVSDFDDICFYVLRVGRRINSDIDTNNDTNICIDSTCNKMHYTP